MGGCGCYLGRMDIQAAAGYALLGVDHEGHGLSAGHHGLSAGHHGLSAGRHGLSAGRHGLSAGRHGLSAGRHGLSAGRHGLSADVAVMLAAAGYALVGVDYEGHGLSAGRHGYIRSFTRLADDVIEFANRLRGSPNCRFSSMGSPWEGPWRFVFLELTTQNMSPLLPHTPFPPSPPANPRFSHLPFFLYGESMGGAMAIQVARRDPTSWNGAVLVAPMCKVGPVRCSVVMSGAGRLVLNDCVVLRGESGSRPLERSSAGGAHGVHGKVDGDSSGEEEEGVLPFHGVHQERSVLSLSSLLRLSLSSHPALVSPSQMAQEMTPPAPAIFVLKCLSYIFPTWKLVPMAQEMTPPAPVIFVLKCLSYIFPTWKLVPVSANPDNCFQVPEKRERVENHPFAHHAPACIYTVPEKRERAEKHPFAYQDKPRLGTALQLLRVTQDIGAHMEEVTVPLVILHGAKDVVTVPLLILHGAKDMVTDPAASQELFIRASSADKEIKIYEGCWHALTCGEPDDVIARVVGDIIAWLNARSLPPGSAPAGGVVDGTAPPGVVKEGGGGEVGDATASDEMSKKAEREGGGGLGGDVEGGVVAAGGGDWGAGLGSGGAAGGAGDDVGDGGGDFPPVVGEFGGVVAEGAGAGVGAGGVWSMPGSTRTSGKRETYGK
ncbi:unnamed protein product [Closterium sp. NIES-65]|nr:unnamed protein product [Closterium sp. NIES-65]